MSLHTAAFLGALVLLVIVTFTGADQSRQSYDSLELEVNDRMRMVAGTFDRFSPVFYVNTYLYDLRNLLSDVRPRYGPVVLRYNEQISSLLVVALATSAEAAQLTTRQSPDEALNQMAHDVMQDVAKKFHIASGIIELNRYLGDLANLLSDVRPKYGPMVLRYNEQLPSGIVLPPA
ncbi:hypothetical protein quinque_003061 [Culex quinquefasciatus]